MGRDTIFRMVEEHFRTRNLVQSWNRCHGAFYQVRDADLNWLLREQDWLSYFSLDIAGVPALFAEATEKGVAAGISRKTIWLSCYGEIAPARSAQFAAELDRLAPARGKTRLTIGGEDFHLIPGIPTAPEDAGLSAVAEQLGFNFTEAVDYAGPLKTEAIESYARAANASDLRLETVVTESAMAELGAYLLREFPGRWEREFRFWRDREDTRRAFWNLLKRDSEICGFSRLSVRGEAGGWLPGALKLPLVPGSGGASTDSCLGPIGISSVERGRGAGKALLGLSLQFLLHRGAEHLCVDWTNAYNYYNPLGLVVVRKYRSAWKDY